MTECREPNCNKCIFKDKCYYKCVPCTDFQEVKENDGIKKENKCNI